MLHRVFDPQKGYHVVIYLRMSSTQQNERSPDQQWDEIKRRLKALKLPWIVVKVYRDEAKSGRLLRNRPAYQQMMREIKSGVVKADLILVDTLERFGRVAELPLIRKELDERFGILVLTGDSNFADPNTASGRALGTMDAARAMEDGHNKAHNVLRGKVDACELKHWPGGSPPFGFMLKTVFGMFKGREVVDHAVIVPNPETDWIIKLLFETALTEKWGTMRLAKYLNTRDDIPDKFKPFQWPTIGYWLDHKIYYGELVWLKNHTGIVDDARIVEPAKPEEIRRIPEFCQPLVSREVWDSVQALREIRRENCPARRKKQAKVETGKLIEPSARGTVLTYPLTGLVCCGRCGRAMNCGTGGGYTAVDGSRHIYTTYVCPGFLGGLCPNGKRIKEAWLWEVVITRLCERLFSQD